MIISSVRHNVQTAAKSPFEVRMSLMIRNLQKNDVGTYRCAAKNSLGEVESSIRLYGEYTASFRPLSNEVSHGAHKEYLIRLLDGTQSKRGGGELCYPRRISFLCMLHLRIIAILSTSLSSLFLPFVLFLQMVVALGIKISYRKIKPMQIDRQIIARERSAVKSLLCKLRMSYYTYKHRAGINFLLVTADNIYFPDNCFVIY